MNDYNIEEDIGFKPCEYCGNKHSTYRPNPYIQAISQQDEYEYICDDCYSNLCGSI